MREPVRGSIPDPSFLSLSGLEQMRAFARGLVPSTPLARLLEARLTQVSSGTIVLTQTVSPWFDINEGFVDLTAIAEAAIWVAAVTGAPAASHVRTVNISVRYLRPCTVDSETIIARARIVHAGSSFTTVEALIEDSLGRAVAHATGSLVVRAMDPPPPPLSGPLQPVDEATYTSPDPARRPVPARQPIRLGDPIERLLSSMEDPTLLSPLGQFLGIRLAQVSERRVAATMSATEWFCQTSREVSAGVLGAFGQVTAGWALVTVGRPDQRLVVVNTTFTSLGPIVAEGQALTAVATVRHRQAERLVTEIDVSVPGGQTLFTGQGTILLLDRKSHAGRRSANRLLLTVVFTDVVGSTARASQLGDSDWGELLEEHNAVVRRQLELFRGREVKTTGDGFLATFESPTRAIQCVQAIRTGVERLGLTIRAGIHSGECDVTGDDVSGLAVHVAARVQSAAEPGEILVTSTVRDLAAGTALGLVDRGDHILKGLDGKWSLFAVDG